MGVSDGKHLLSAAVCLLSQRSPGGRAVRALISGRRSVSHGDDVLSVSFYQVAAQSITEQHNVLPVALLPSIIGHRASACDD